MSHSAAGHPAQRRLGTSGLAVSTVGPGCNNFGMRLGLHDSRPVKYRRGADVPQDTRLAAQPAVSSVIAGATSVEQIRANVAAGSWRPTVEDLAALDEIVPSRRP